MDIKFGGILEKMIMDQKITISDNGFEFLESYFKDLYGELGRGEQIIKRYLNGVDYCVPNRIVKKIEDIPLITRKDINKIIQYEEKKKEVIN